MKTEKQQLQPAPKAYQATRYPNLDAKTKQNNEHLHIHSLWNLVMFDVAEYVNLCGE